ncbi:MAG: hypothetical protein J0L97_04310 [Alphaproteobacteria bacterium]|nr:hypothetical protein [Alphaproteobacteria bacterium]
MAIADINASIAAQTTKTAAQQAATNLADQKDVFLKLLTTQLKNQDPSQPMDTNQFTQQLVMFSQTEQTVQMNANLEKLLAQNAVSSSTAAANLIGKRIRSESNAIQYDGTNPVDFSYELPAAAETVTVAVTTASGRAIFTANGVKESGMHNVRWLGNKDDGSTAEAGPYQISIVAKDRTGQPLEVKTYTDGAVQSVAIVDGKVTLQVNGKDVAFENVSLISGDPTATQPPGGGSTIDTKGVSMDTALSLIGKKVRTSASSVAHTKGKDSKIAYELPANVKGSRIDVYDASNNLVYSQQGEITQGISEFTWNGMMSSGEYADSGNYRVTVSANLTDDTTVSSQPFVEEVVQGATFPNGQVLLQLPSKSVGLQDILSVALNGEAGS